MIFSTKVSSEATLTDYELKALQAIALGRIPASEKVRARLKRRGLIARGIYPSDRRLYHVTMAGRHALDQAREGTNDCS